MEMNGIAHIQLTVNDYPACRAFYRQLFGKLGMKAVHDTDEVIYGIGSRTGILVRASAAEFRHQRFEQWRIGLHHFCFRARSREDVDELHAFLVEIGARVVHAPEEGPWERALTWRLAWPASGTRPESIARKSPRRHATVGPLRRQTDRPGQKPPRRSSCRLPASRGAGSSGQSARRQTASR